MDTACRIRLLGPLCVEIGDHRITRFRTRKSGALLGYLAYYRHKVHSREEIIERFWPDRETESGRNSLSIALSILRTELGPFCTFTKDLFLSERTLVQLNSELVSTDVAEAKI